MIPIDVIEHVLSFRISSPHFQLIQEFVKEYRNSWVSVERIWTRLPRHCNYTRAIYEEKPACDTYRFSFFVLHRRDIDVVNYFDNYGTEEGDEDDEEEGIDERERVEEASDDEEDV